MVPFPKTVSVTTLIIIAFGPSSQIHPQDALRGEVS